MWCFGWPSVTRADVFSILSPVFGYFIIRIIHLVFGPSVIGVAWFVEEEIGVRCLIC
jgi:hypothetical protein